MSRRPLFPPVFAPTVSHPLVDDFSLRASRLQSRQAPVIPAAYSMPLRNHPMWSGNNELGREVAFAPDANNRQTIIKMEEWGPPNIWTIALGLNFDTRNTPDSAFEVAAQIQFGVGGVVQQLEMDWLQGAAITLPGNSFVVNALYPINSDPSSAVPADLVLRASISQSQSNQSQPTRSYLTVHPVTTPITVIPIPPFARDVFVGLRSAAGAVTQFAFATNVILSFQRGSDDSPTTLAAMTYPATQVLSWLDFANQLVGAPVPVPVPEGARSLAVIWAPGGVPANPPVQFVWRAQYRLGL